MVEMPTTVVADRPADVLRHTADAGQEVPEALLVQLRVLVERALRLLT